MQWEHVQIDRAKPHHAQICDCVRQRIVAGDLKPGQQLPSTHDLARMLHTHVPTVHAAMRQLVSEGLLVRQRKRGTFVRQREAKLTCVGIFHTQDNWAKGASDFERAVHAALTEQLDQLGIRTRVWIDSRPKQERDTPWAELVQAAEQREIQGLICMPTGWPAIRWLNKVPIPAAFLGSANIPNRVDANHRQFVELSLRALTEQGCRSVGLIAPIASSSTNPDGTRHVLMDFFEHFTNLAGDLGLAIRNEWMRVTQDEDDPRGQAQERYGYDEFLQLWSQSERPEGLIVVPDTTVRGVILGLQAQRVRVPEDLKLVLQKNEAIDLLCTVPATFVIVSEREYARALITQVQKKFRGEPCEPINVSFRLAGHRANSQREINQPVQERGSA